jgi:hypothetical protein
MPGHDGERAYNGPPRNIGAPAASFRCALKDRL